MKRSHLPAACAILLTTCLSQAAGILTDTTPVYDENVNQPNTISRYYTNNPLGNTQAAYTAFTSNVTTAYNANLGGVIDDWVPQLNSRTTGDGVGHSITGQAWGTSLGSNGFSSYTNSSDPINTPTAGIFVSFDDVITNPAFSDPSYHRDWTVVESDLGTGAGASFSTATSDRFGNTSSGIGGYLLELGTSSIGGALIATDYYPTVSVGYDLTSLGMTISGWTQADVTATAYFSNGTSSVGTFSTYGPGNVFENVFWGVEAPVGERITHFNIHGTDNLDPMSPQPARIYLDDLALIVTASPVPESSSSALVILTGLGLAARRRRVA